jgi:hypothetical protein
VETESTRPKGATVFVSDPSVEAERVAQSLRSSGFVVVDVPLSMLVARVAVQRPRVILVDADADGALQAIARLRELPDSEHIDVLFMGRVGVALAGTEDALTHEGSGFFPRPVDVPAIVEKIQALTFGAIEGEEARRALAAPLAMVAIEDVDKSRAIALTVMPTGGASVPPQQAPAVSASPEATASVREATASVREATASVREAPAPPPESPESNRPPALLPPASMRAERISQPPPPLAAPSQVPPGASRVSQPPPAPSVPALGARISRPDGRGPLSDELAELLADAEERVGAAMAGDSHLPTPEEEIEAVLPEEVLAALDEPLEEHEDDGDLNESSMGGSHPRTTTSGGGSKATTGASRRHTTGAGGASITNEGLSGYTPQKTYGDIAAITTHHQRQSKPASMMPPNDDGLSEVPPANEPQQGHGHAPASWMPASPRERPGAAVRPATASDRRPDDSRPPPTAFGPPQNMLSTTLGSEVLSQNLGNFDARASVPPTDEGPAVVPAHDASASLKAESVPPPDLMPTVLGPGDAPRALASAIARRVTGTLCYESKEGVRRAVLREGDLVTAASGVDDESLIAFLVARGDLPRERLQHLAGRFATFGRHAGAALVAHGYLRQDQLWNVLRAHAEWILARALLITEGSATIEPDPPGRLRGEPSVFGGSTGAEVLVEVVRRVVAPEDAIGRLGGGASRIGDGPNGALLTECALGSAEVQILERGRGQTIDESLETSRETDMASVLYALSLLGVIEIVRSIEGPRTDDASRADVDALDEGAIRDRVRARMALVDEGDYFAVLGVSKSATSYEIRRAFLELRRAFDPARLLTVPVADLAPDVRKIIIVLEEAYDILRDAARRERYRRAIEMTS